MKVWVVLWGDDGGYSDDVRLFSTKRKVYDYLYSALRQQKKNYEEYDEANYYLRKYDLLIETLNDTFDHDYITFSIPDFSGYFEVQLIEVDD